MLPTQAIKTAPPIPRPAVEVKPNQIPVLNVALPSELLVIIGCINLLILKCSLLYTVVPSRTIR